MVKYYFIEKNFNTGYFPMGPYDFKDINAVRKWLVRFYKNATSMTVYVSKTPYYEGNTDNISIFNVILKRPNIEDRRIIGYITISGKNVIWHNYDGKYLRMHRVDAKTGKLLPMEEPEYTHIKKVNGKYVWVG